MPKKSWTRLVGWLVIELTCALSAFAAGYSYKAGYAPYGDVKALAVEDRRGHRAVIAMAGFDVPLSVADSIAAQAIKDYKLERADLLIYSVAGGPPAPQDALTAIGAALGKLQSAYLMYGNGRLTVSGSDGHCLVALSATASLGACPIPAGDTVGGYMRSALQMVDQEHGLLTRDQTPRSIAIQAIALGGSLVIFSGPSNFAQTGKGIILAATPDVEGDTRLNQAVGEVFLRVGGRPR